MKFQTLKISDLKASEINPRFHLSEIADLAQSIKAHGVIEPIVVCLGLDGSWTILAGHRRVAAAEKAGLTEIPAVIRDDSDVHAVVHLVENIQRVDLSPMETAIAVGGALATGYKGKDLAKQLGRSAAWVSKFSTICKAWAKLESEKKEAKLQSFVTATDADKLYAEAQSVLGLNKAEKQGKLEIEQEEEKDDERASGPEKAELEVIKDLRELAELQGKIAATAVTGVEPHGKAGYRVTYTYKSEKAARAALELSK